MGYDGWGDGDWTDAAACQGMDVEAFFATTMRTSAVALTICHGCPVRAECKQYAEKNREAFGIWGGLTARQRGWP
ncbi:WhiB family transcriptional regulator [Streptomyces sp. NBC_00096]|uniref:WhiB family transcriptional regulator n=1 Tax=Streptomyces sp. NBC_00096 TaxID=2975650 RepID=UPI003248A925